MPSAEYMKKHGADPKKSPAFNMEQPKKGGRHRQTSTYGRKMTGTEKRLTMPHLQEMLWHMICGMLEKFIKNKDFTKKSVRN